MTEEQENVATTASEESNVESQDAKREEQKMVPLAAYEAERRKRQEAERARDELSKMHKEPEVDPHRLVENQDLHQHTTLTKREILEQVYQDMNPEGVRMIEKHLGKILERKPWLAGSIDTAQNRYARAHEIVTDYLHLVDEKPKAEAVSNDARKVIQNAQKPRSPVEVGKSANPTGAEYLKSIQGTKEFREYRKSVRGRG